MDKFKRIEKTFVLSDGSVNCYGYRLLTEGYLAGKYQRNPIGYFMHQRDGGVLLKWDNIRVEGDEILAEPVINLSHPRGLQTVDEIESGFLNAASMGRIIPLEWNDEPQNKLGGQTGITITKWYNKECSLVDIPGNDNALAHLYDEQDNQLNLSDFSKRHTMKKIEIQVTPDLIRQLNLSDDADSTAVHQGINAMLEKAGKADQLEADNLALWNELSGLKSASIAKEVNTLLTVALQAGKITKETQTQLAADYKENPEGLKSLLEKLPMQKSVVKQISSATTLGGKRIDDLTWDELDKGGYLKDLRTTNWELYERKFEEAFGSRPRR